MVQSSVAPEDPAAARGISRRTQSEIYRAGISGTKPRVPVDADALEAAARKALSAEAFAYIAGGAGAERTMRANRAAFDRWQVWPRPLRDVSTRDLSIDFLGRRRPTPLLLAPLGVMEMAHGDADLAVARAAASLGVPYTLSNQASVAMEEVRDAAPGGSRLFQLYWSASDDLNASLLRRAEASGCEAIVVTLDTHLLGWRTRDLDLAYLPFTRGMGIAQYTSDPVFQELVRERVRASTGSATDDRRRRAAAREAHAEGHRGGREDRAQGRAAHGRRTARESALAAAARGRRDLPRRVLDAGAHVGRPRQGARVDDAADHPQGDRAPRRRGAGPRRRRRRRVGLEPRRAPDRPVRADARGAARTSSSASAGGFRSSSTPACDRARTRSSPSPSAPPRSRSAGRTRTDWASPARPACAR